MTKMTGSRFLAETLKGYGVSHVFFMPVFGIGALKEIEELGMRRIMVHGEKPTAWAMQTPGWPAIRAYPSAM